MEASRNNNQLNPSLSYQEELKTMSDVSHNSTINQDQLEEQKVYFQSRNNNSSSQLNQPITLKQHQRNDLKRQTKKFTTPTISSGGPSLSNLQLPLQQQQMISKSPTKLKVIDLRNFEIRKQVMQSLKEVSKQRKSKNAKKIILKGSIKPFSGNQSSENSNVTTPKPQNPVLVEKDDLTINSQVSSLEQTLSLPPSRVSNGESEQQRMMTNMTPRTQTKLFNQLEQIAEEQDLAKTGADYEEEPYSPEYSIMSALDDSCLLFAVKENQSDPRVLIRSNVSSLESTQRFMTPTMSIGGAPISQHDPQTAWLSMPNPDMNMQDPDSWVTSGTNQIVSQLIQRLQGLEQQNSSSEEQSVFDERFNQQQQNQDNGLIESLSLDRQYMMIQNQNIPRRTPIIKAPQVTRQPSTNQISFFDLSIQEHLDELCNRLEKIQTSDQREQPRAVQRIIDEEKQTQLSNNFKKSMDGGSTFFINNNDNQKDKESSPGSAKTPYQTEKPVSREETLNAIDTDLLISKLMEIPNSARSFNTSNENNITVAPFQATLSQHDIMSSNQTDNDQDEQLTLSPQCSQ